MSQHVDKMDVQVSGLDGISLSVQRFELSVAVNSIPSILLEVLPIDRGGEQGTQATAPDFGDLTRLYYALYEKTKTLSATATITIDITRCAGDEESKEQKVELKDWVLSDVGLSSITSYAAPTLTAVFRHPIVALDHSGTIYEKIQNVSDLDNLFVGLGMAGNVVDIMDAVYDVFSDESSIEYYDVSTTENGGPDADAKEVVSATTKMLKRYKPGNYIACDADIFLGDIAGDLYEYIGGAIAKLVAPSPWSASTWVRIINVVCPSMIMQVVPTYDQEKLRLEPYNPWQDCGITIDSKKVEAIDVTSVDPDPIYGLAIEKYPGNMEYVVSGQVRRLPDNVDNPEACGNAFYFPESVTAETVISHPGRIEIIDDNQVLAEARNLEIGMNTVSKDVKKDEKSANYDESKAHKFTDGDEQFLRETIAEAMFNSNYRKRCLSSVTTIPAFRDASGNMIYPGRVMTVYADGSPKIFYGYLSRMTITCSADGHGSSYYEMMTSRPADDSSLVHEGTPNPCYGINDD